MVLPSPPRSECLPQNFTYIFVLNHLGLLCHQVVNPWSLSRGHRGLGAQAEEALGGSPERGRLHVGGKGPAEVASLQPPVLRADPLCCLSVLDRDPQLWHRQRPAPP